MALTAPSPDLTRSPVGHGSTSQFGHVVTEQHRRIGITLVGQAVEFADQVLASDAALS